MSSTPVTPQQGSGNNHQIYSPSEESDEEADTFIMRGSNSNYVRDDQRQALNELNFRDNWETEEDVDAYLAQLGEMPEYNVREKLKQINKEWATDGENLSKTSTELRDSIESSGRKPRVVFKDNLVDVVASVPDYDRYSTLSEGDEEEENQQRPPFSDQSPESPSSVSAPPPLDGASTETSHSQRSPRGVPPHMEGPPTRDTTEPQKVVPSLNLSLDDDRPDVDDEPINARPNRTTNAKPFRSISSPLHEEDEERHELCQEDGPSLSAQGTSSQNSSRTLVMKDGRYEFVNKMELQPSPVGQSASESTSSPNQEYPQAADQTGSPTQHSPEKELLSEEDDNGSHHSSPRSSEYSSEHYSEDEEVQSGREESHVMTYESHDSSQLSRVKSAGATSRRRQVSDPSSNASRKKIQCKSNTENERIFLSWLEKKRKQSAEEKHRQLQEERVSKGSPNEDEKDKDEAMRNWKKKKRRQKRDEDRLKKAREEEEKLSAIRHTEAECKRAFKKWLRRKQKERREQEEMERERIRLTNLALRKSRRSQALAAAIERANNLGYCDYHGYRV